MLLNRCYFTVYRWTVNSVQMFWDLHEILPLLYGFLSIVYIKKPKQSQTVTNCCYQNAYVTGARLPLHRPHNGAWFYLIPWYPRPLKINIVNEQQFSSNSTVTRCTWPNIKDRRRLSRMRDHEIINFFPRQLINFPWFNLKGTLKQPSVSNSILATTSILCWTESELGW